MVKNGIERQTSTAKVLKINYSKGREQGGGNYTSRVVCPDGSFARVMRLMRYLCENGIGPGQWLDVLDDLHQPYRPLAAVEDEPGEENSREFVPFAGFNTENLLHNTELTQSV